MYIKKHLIVQNIFATSSQNKPTDFFNANSLAHAFKSNPFSTSYTYIKKYVHSDKLRKFLTYLSFFQVFLHIEAQIITPLCQEHFNFMDFGILKGVCTLIFKP